ncbi:MAG TPA: penicillin-binding transpeptidase domain-containing protein [Solirubrobacteraceae bacterium]|nr:penicillin-binding transpeptidase domain-containing protein [Solirubrobacteraceae bacterium]
MIARITALVALVAVTLAGAFLAYRALIGEGAEDAAEVFVGRWSAGDDAAAARLTDAPQAAAAALRANRRGLDGASLKATLGDVKESGDSATAVLSLQWRIPRIGGWGYDSTLRLRRSGDEWRVRWSPQTVHPKLDAETRLGTTSVPKARGEILDRERRPLMRERRVVRVGAIAGKVRRPAVTARGLADVLGVDAGPLARAIRGGGREQFVDALTLRPPDYRRLRARLEAVPDAATAEGTAMLAPTREFARALLGTVAPATAEQIEKLGGRVAPGASVGQWGLQARFEPRLAPVPERRVVIRAGAVPIEMLAKRAGRSGRSVATTLDRRVQAAAEAALADTSDEAALVAVQPSTGDVLAVANRPVASSYNRALEGTYAPGSTFKVVSTAALLRDGLDVADTVRCPPTLEAGGRQFKNFEGGAAGAVPFSRDFAVSCNTAFVSLAPRLAPDALGRTARDYGLGRKLHLAVPAASGRVPRGEDAVERAAAMIGQHEIVASPLAMALVAATVADGRWRAPRLLASAPKQAGPALAASERDTLRGLMRLVVTEGSGTALAGVDGEVRGKSGTAEFGGGDPPPTHAWFIAFRDDVAMAVLVERGRSGGSVAAPLAARFFTALDQGGMHRES